MKILFAASEVAPFVKTGGLADVAGSLPAALAAHGHDIRVVLPLYSDIAEEWREQMQIQTIGHDKVNQLRHARYFKDIHGMVQHMIVNMYLEEILI